MERGITMTLRSGTRTAAMRRGSWSLCVGVLALQVALIAAPAGAAKARNACKLLKPAQITKVLGAPAARSDVAGAAVAGGESCAFDVGPGLGEPGGGMVVVTYYSGALAKGFATDVKTRSQPLTKGAVWDPDIESAFVIKRDSVTGVNVSYTSDSPSTEELKPQMAKLAKAAAKRT
jgi:hypothetical protein